MTSKHRRGPSHPPCGAAGMDPSLAPLLAALVLGFTLGGVLGAAAMVVLLQRLDRALNDVFDLGAPPGTLGDKTEDMASDLGYPALRRRLAERCN